MKSGIDKRIKCYMVGGAVRDRLLGLPCHDKDWVVVGSTPEEMISLGFKPVGKDFPVFIHPESSEEYALARTERKVRVGHKGFQFSAEPTVTLEEDLLRRDLTINAMAEDPRQGKIIDPFNGQRDLKAKRLCHVSPAFSEDPLRVLRIARFSAQLQFSVEENTLQLLKNMVQSGELLSLSKDRIWGEFDRALATVAPFNFFEILYRCGALSDLFAELLPLVEKHADGLQNMLKKNTMLTLDNEIILAALTHVLSEEAFATWTSRYPIPRRHQALCRLVLTLHAELLEKTPLSPESLLNILTKIDVFRRPTRFQQFILAMHMVAEMQADSMGIRIQQLQDGAETVAKVGTDSGISVHTSGEAIAVALKEKRLKALRQKMQLGR